MGDSRLTGTSKQFLFEIHFEMEQVSFIFIPVPKKFAKKGVKILSEARLDTEGTYHSRTTGTKCQATGRTQRRFVRI